MILVEGVLHLGGLALVQLGLTGATPVFTCMRIPFGFAWLAWAINYARVIDGCREMMSRVVRRAEYLIENPGPLPAPSPACSMIPEPRSESRLKFCASCSLIVGRSV